MPHHDLLRHSKLGKSLTLELGRIDWRRTCEMHLHVDQRGGEVFDSRKTLIERRCLLDSIHEVLRNRLSRLVMQRKLLEDLRRRDPVLEQLRRELHIVARHSSA